MTFSLLRTPLTIAFAAVMLAACSGGNGDNDGGDPGTPPPVDGGGPDAPERSSCQEDFSIARANSDEDCAPRYHEFCASTAGDGQFTHEEVVPCDGVQVDVVDEENPESFSGRLGYTVLRPASGTPSAVVTNLHFRQLGRQPSTSAATHAVQMRQSELVKARNAMIILPGAPGGVWPAQRLADLAAAISDGTITEELLLELLDNPLLNGNPLLDALAEAGLPLGFVEDLLAEEGGLAELGELLGDVTPTTNSTQDFMDYIELVREDALARFGGSELPQFMAGLSNGGLYALRFACQRPEGLDVIMSVASSMGPVEAEECRGADPIGTVQVHGAADFVAPYRGIPGYGVRGGSALPLDPDLLGGDELPLPEIPLDELLELPGLFLDVFGPNNGCSGDLRMATIPAGAAGRGEEAGDVIVEAFEQCSNPQNRQSFMVTIERGGHNWPGYDAPSGNNVNPLGVVSYDFDATLYGFDLMWQAAGLD